MSDAIPSGWAPVSVAPRAGRLVADCRAVDLDGLRAAFFDEDVNAALGDPFAAVFPAYADLDELAAQADRHPPAAPAALIFHSSRCGSSLLVRLLQGPPRRVIAEPSALTLLLRHSAGRPPDERAGLARALVDLFCRAEPGAEPTPTILKLEAWDTLDLPLLQRAFPATPWVFLYREPVEVIVSQLLTPSGALASRVDVAWRLGVSLSAALAMPIEELCARLLGATYAAARASLGAAHILISYPELPAAALVLPRHLGLPWSAADGAHARRIAQLHAKHPTEYFSDDTAAKRRAATPAILAAAERWAYPAYAALEEARRTATSRSAPHA